MSPLEVLAGALPEPGKIGNPRHVYQTPEEVGEEWVAIGKRNYIARIQLWERMGRLPLPVS